MKTDLAQRLSSFREAHSLTQEQLAEQLHVSRQAISKWECGDAIPDLDNLTALSRLYDISLDKLVGNETKEKSKASVHVSFKDGVNVQHNNKGVHVGWDGVHIDDSFLDNHIHEAHRDSEKESDKSHGVHITDDGIWVCGERYDNFRDAQRAWEKKRPRSAFARIPVIPLLFLAFLFLGLFWGQWLLGLGILAWAFVWSCLANVVDAIYFKRGSKKICNEVASLIFSCGLSSFLFFGFAFGEWGQIGPHLPFPGWNLILIGLLGSIAVRLIWPKAKSEQ